MDGRHGRRCALARRSRACPLGEQIPPNGNAPVGGTTIVQTYSEAVGLCGTRRAPHCLAGAPDIPVPTDVSRRAPSVS